MICTSALRETLISRVDGLKVKLHSAMSEERLDHLLIADLAQQLKVYDNALQAEEECLSREAEDIEIYC